jgi:hypothetical protein
METASGADAGAPPMSESGGGDLNFFSQDLGTILRLRYNTQSYGQDGTGNFDIGTMQVVTMDDTAAFFDGQVTMNESDGVGFNVGLGYRWMNFPPYAANSGRMDGISLWADGTHTDSGNFFPQVGVSYESLGELWDIRANGYIPVGQKEQVGAFKNTNELGFIGNSIDILTKATVDRSFYSAELEIARRLGAEREAWGFAGPYFVANDIDSSAGFRAGVRGYAYPDLLLQFAVSDDDVFKTNATFQIVWFVGRTRTNFQPACNTADRMREPVMRNDYVVLSHTKRSGTGTTLTQPDGTALRVVHVDSNAAAGGDGTIEHPFDMLTDVNGTGSQKGDVILAHSTSVFTNEPSVILKDNQKLFGEGNNLIETVATKQKGTITIPESSPGARALARPIINIPANTDAVVLADNNEVANFVMDGQNLAGNRAIAAPVTGAGNPNLHDLSIKNTGSDAIFFTPEDFIDVNDVNGNGNTTERLVRGNVTIKTVTLDNIGGDGIHIDSANPNALTATLQETIALTDVTSTNGAGRGINLENTHTGAGHTATITNYTYDGGTTSAGGIRLNNINDTVNVTGGSLTNGSVASNGVQIVGATGASSAITFQTDVALTSLDGTAVDINGDVVGTDSIKGSITFQGPITNDTGRSVSVQNIAAGANVTFAGLITDTGDGIRVNGNSGGTVSFNGNQNMTVDTAGATAVSVTNNTGSTTNFTGNMTINATNGANGFIANGGGTLSANGTTNAVSTDTGQPVQINGMIIGANGAHFGDVNRTAAAGTNAIQIENNTGGPITIGNTTDTVGEAGTIVGGTADAVRIVNSANVAVTGLQINNTSAVSGVHVENSGAAASTINLNDLGVSGGDIGIETLESSTGVLTMTVNDTNVTGSTTNGMATTASGTGRLALLIDHTSVTTGGVDSFALTFSGVVADHEDVIIRDNSSFTATGDAHALNVDQSASTVRMLIQGSQFTNNGATTTASYLAHGTAGAQTTVQGNTFLNNGAGDNFAMTSNDTAIVNLNLGGTAAADKNTATGGTGDFVLTETAGTFSVFDKTNLFLNARNNGTVVPVPNAAAFDDAPTAPALPTVP